MPPFKRAFKIHGHIHEPVSPKPLRDGGRADFLRSVPRPDYGSITEDDLLQSQFLRMNCLYSIVDKCGNVVPFSMRREQYDFFRNMHNLNIILKSRQLGMTTLIQLYLLDTALFTPNTSCGVIAHTREDADRFFKKKIKFALEHVPKDFAARHVPESEQDREGHLTFANGSFISVGTSLRSDTLQYLHISEFGKLCARFPEKAAEVVSGALNTVAVGNHVIIESTGEGAHGHFYDMCRDAKKIEDIGQELSLMDYKFFFYPWWINREYRLAVYQEPAPEDYKYFRELSEQSNIILDREQCNWYIAKRREQKDRMWREYPSTPDESFRGIIDGAPFSRTMATLRRQGQLTRVPWVRHEPVNTFWDLGRNDKTAIWFHQKIGFEDRFIEYFEDNLRPLSDYAQVLHEKPYVYGEHYLPHDVNVTDLSRSDAMSRKEVLESLGVRPIIVVERVRSEEEGVNATREQMDSVWIDAEKCEQGIRCLENLKYRFDDKLQEFQPNLMRTWAKHGADSFMQWGHGYRHCLRDRITRDTDNVLARDNRGTGRSSRSANQRRNDDWRL